MDSLFDQSALTALAERLVKAARAAGADARRCGRDALGVAVGRGARRRGRGIAALRGRRHRPARPGRQAPGGGLDQRHQRRRRRRRWPNARWRWRASRRRTAYAGLADPALLAQQFPRSRSGRSRRCRTSARWSRPRAAPRTAGLAVKGVSKSGGASASAGIGGMVLLTSHGFSGAYLGSRHGVSMQAIAGEGTAMETRLRFLLGAARRRSRSRRKRSAAPPASARWRGSIRARSRPARCRWCSIARVAGSLIGHLASAINGSCDRAQDELPQGQARRADFRAGHPHHRRSAAPARPALAAVRRRRRRRPTHGAGRGRRAQDLAARQRDRARARACRPPAMPQRGVSSTPSPAPTNLHLEPGTAEPRRS